MSKIEILFSSILIIILVILFSRAVAAETYEVDMKTVRVYSETEQKGLFTTKENTYDYIEYTFEFYGELHVDRELITNIDIGDETKVIVTGHSSGNVVYTDLELSMDDYKKIYGVEE